MTSIIILVSISIISSLLFTLFSNKPRLSPWMNVAIICVLWRLTIWLVTIIAIIYTEQINTIGKNITIFGSPVVTSNIFSHSFISAWFHWDTGFYQDIAQNGYKFSGEWPTIAFFPLYPLTVRAIMSISGASYQVSALLFSHVTICIATGLLYSIVKAEINEKTAYRAIIFLLFFPTSFFFIVAYTESLALMLVILAVWAIRRQRWWLAGVAGFLLALTRLPGVLIAPIMAITFVQIHGLQWQILKRPSLYAICLPPLGLGIFMLYQWWTFGTPFAFMIAQQAWDNRLQPPWAMPYELITTLSAADWPMKILQSATWITFIILVILAFRKLPLVYGLVMLFFLTPPYLSSWNESLPRYVLIAFPAYIVFGIITERPWARFSILLLNTFLLCMCTVLFINDFWIS